jgi:hypothetical protein
VRERGKFGAWIAHVTLSLCADHRRRRGTRRLGEPITVLNEASENADYAERLAIKHALAHLSDAHRTTVLLHYVGGWSLEEVAGLLAVPVNTVRSRLMAAKRYLRADLGVAPTPAVRTPKVPVASESFALTEAHTSLLHAAFPDARILSVQTDPEPWMPFQRRVSLGLPGGEERTVDVRGDVDPELAARLPVLERLGVPGPRLIHPPVPDGEGGYRSVAEVARGENLLLWALGGTPHRIRLATASGSPPNGLSRPSTASRG